VAIPTPVAVFNGEMNSPVDWRIPIVIMSAAAATVTAQYEVARDCGIATGGETFVTSPT
jgi:hypothetical protein